MSHRTGWRTFCFTPALVIPDVRGAPGTELTGASPLEVVMLSAAVALEARCPLCSSSILSLGRGGRLEAEDLHSVPLYTTRRPGEGYILCDECALLAELPGELALN